MIQAGIHIFLLKERCCLIDENTKISVTAPSFDFNDKECIFHLQKTLLLTLYESKRLSFNQYQYAVKLLEKKFRQR